MSKFTLTLLIFTLLSFNFILSGQINSGRVTYGVSADEFVQKVKKTHKSKGIKRKSVFESIAAEMHRIELVLSFKDSISVFEKAPGLAVDHSERIFSLAVSFAIKGTHFTDITSQQLIFDQEYLGERILVESKLNIKDWKLTKDQKKIGDFDCFKAVSSIITPGGEFPIIAWYTPEIPFAFGPSDYGGNLPGLILELLTNEASYFCKEIELNPKKKVVIKWPKSEKTISQVEYDNINKKLNESYNKKN